MKAMNAIKLNEVPTTTSRISSHRLGCILQHLPTQVDSLRKQYPPFRIGNQAATQTYTKPSCFSSEVKGRTAQPIQAYCEKTAERPQTPTAVRENPATQFQKCRRQFNQLPGFDKLSAAFGAAQPRRTDGAAEQRVLSIISPEAGGPLKC